VSKKKAWLVIVGSFKDWRFKDTGHLYIKSNMGHITLKQFPNGSRKNENTQVEYDNDIQQDRYRFVVDRVSKSEISQTKVCYVFGMGGHPKSSYTELKRIGGADVVWSYSLMPKVLWPLNLFVASYAGIVRIRNMEMMPQVFELLAKKSMVGLYIFDKSIEDFFIDTVKRYRHDPYLEENVKARDKGYFIYEIDADNHESSTGIIEIVSYGIECAKSLTGILTLS